LGLRCAERILQGPGERTTGTVQRLRYEIVVVFRLGSILLTRISSQIRKQLDTVVSPKSKLTKPIKKPKARWVEPSFTAEVEFRDITSDGLLRQSSFKGLWKGTRRT
jgi:ATP-dependent DNA ligase